MKKYEIFKTVKINNSDSRNYRNKFKRSISYLVNAIKGKSIKNIQLPPSYKKSSNDNFLLKRGVTAHTFKS